MRNNDLGASDLRRLRDRAACFEHKPLVSVLLPVSDPNAPHLRETLDSVIGQVYPDWELRVVVAGPRGEFGRTLPLYASLDGRVKVEGAEDGVGEAGLWNVALSRAEGEFVAFVDPGDELAPDALFGIVEVLQENRGAGLVYSDHDHVDGRGERSRPSFKPGWSPDLILSHDYLSDLTVYRKALVEEVGGFRDGLDGHHDLALRVAERTDEIHHVPRVLYHRRVSEPSRHSPGAARAVVGEALERRGIAGSVEDGLLPGRLRVKYRVAGQPKVSIIIPTRDNVSTLKNCVESIERHTDYENYEVLIVDNDSVDPATLEYLSSTPHKVVPFREPFNYSRINNFAVSQAEGEYVLLLNDDTEVTEGGWLEEMLGQAQRPGVGAVGAKLLYPNDTVQHAGVLVGVGDPWGPGIAVHAHQFFPDGPGYAGGVQTTANFSAVTAACMLLPKAVFEEAGGLDEENLKVAFNDVDLCLSIRERGYRIVYTPHACLYHHESISRGYGNGNPAELLYMRERWGEVLDNDPYYNAHFSRGGGDYNLRADLMRPRVLRTVGRIPGDPVNTFKSPLLASPEEMQRYVEAHRKASRSAHRTTLVPALPESPSEVLRPGDAKLGEGPDPRRDGDDQVKTPAPVGVGRARGFGNLSEERLIWMFGSPRTGSTWLSRMMAELDNQERWHEPYVGLLFGSFVYERLQNSKLLGNASFIMGEPHRRVWLNSIRNFLLEGARARYPNLRDDQYLVIKEPNGSVGAPLMLEATPTSRLIFLIRDPRDVVASRLDAFRKGSWSAQNHDFDDAEELNAFTKQLADEYLKVVSQVETAYEAHPGPKVLVRYEDLRRDTVGALKGMYDALKITVDENRLEAAAAKHAWEQVPEGNKGPGKFYRKARPGSWEEDLSPEQVRIIEDATGAVLSEFYRADRPV
ncbi:MAG: glycosyltransferase [Rubrobacter sp.]